MQNSVQEAKRSLRERVRAALRVLPAEERSTASAQARNLLKAQVRWQSAQSVLFFAPLSDELDVWPLLSEALVAGKRVALPRFVAVARRYEAALVIEPATDLHRGQFGILEPHGRCARFPSDEMELILVPGVAFDLRGGRLGRGSGYYDQLLGELRGIRCGVAFDQQVVHELPLASHDIRMDFLVTPTRWRDLQA